MESTRLTKIMWGADGDLYSLMHQKQPMPLEMQPREIIDVQLAFSEPGRRVAMKRMLEKCRCSLPDKDQIDFDTPHSRNQRSMPLPLSANSAVYSVDDLHRIAVILQQHRVPHWDLTKAKSMTILQQIANDQHGLKALSEEWVWFCKKRGLKKQVAAVKLQRHIHASRRSLDSEAGMPAYQKDRLIEELKQKENQVRPHLGRTIVRSDLSFNF